MIVPICCQCGVLKKNLNYCVNECTFLRLDSMPQLHVLEFITLNC